ncbi:MAG: serine/threonine-protein kinase [Deltaproteobacteria bacterium]|nr:serine/threonine-protein kinase [Myxococcales bacterium]MDP3221304.1 serine/threonine-protein kinase [Deltaproteobacteria bacterium]
MGDDASNAPLPLGTNLGGKYTLLRVLGTGGMGAVYEANNSWTGRRVAIKVLLTEHIRRKEVVDRFTQEARATTQIAHPNIVDILDMGQDAETGALFIVQEFLDGMDLSRWLEQHGPYAPAEAIEILLPVMGALVAAHRRGVIHRDLKPENIFLARNAGGGLVPKLIDFGISKFVDQTNVERSRTRTGMAVGTPQYMSPEQASGDRDVDARSDVWSMGAVLYELLSGVPPFDAPNYNLLIVQVITQPPPRIETVMPGIPVALAAALHRALEPDRERRFQSMQEFLGALIASTEVADPEAAFAPPQQATVPGAQAHLEYEDDLATRVVPSPFHEPARPSVPQFASATGDLSTPRTSQPTVTPSAWSDAAADAVPESSRSSWRTLAIGAAVGLSIAAVGVGIGLGSGSAGTPPVRPAAAPAVARPTSAAIEPPPAPASEAVGTPSFPAQAPSPPPQAPVPLASTQVRPVPSHLSGARRVPPLSPSRAASPATRGPARPATVPSPRAPAPPAPPPLTRHRPNTTAPIIGID